jgi:FKBP-type peptidyl-prolyl cis-trans isomerase FklB
MRKFGFIYAAVVAGLMASCGTSTPKADLKSDVDTLCYAIGMSQSQGLKDYLSMRMGIDTTYIDEFVKGLNDGANAGDDKKKSAYYAGVQIGQNVSQQMVKGLNQEIFGEDSTQTVSLKNIMAGFIAGTYSSICIATPVWVLLSKAHKTSGKKPAAQKS